MIWRALYATLVTIATITCSLQPNAIGQTTTPASSLNLSGLTTGKLATPGPLTAPSSVGGCVGTGHTWKYKVVAADATGATTDASTELSVTNGCTSLSTTPATPAYISFTVPSVAGAVGCFVYRTAVPSASQHVGKLPNPVPCNNYVFYDTGATDGDTSSAPTVNTTGSVSASGNINALSFQASGVEAQAPVFGRMGPRCPGCVPPTPPCILTSGEFFLQAPVSILTSYGWTAPQSPNSGNTLVYLHPPDSPVGGVSASKLDYITAGTANQVLLGNASAAPSFGQVPNAALVNSSVTVTTSAPLGGGGSLGLGGTLALSVSNATTSATGVVQLAGDLAGTGTSPSVVKVHGVTYPASPGTSTVPVVTATNAITYEQVPNGALANSSITIPVTAPISGGGTVALQARPPQLRVLLVRLGWDCRQSSEQYFGVQQYRRTGARGLGYLRGSVEYVDECK